MAQEALIPSHLIKQEPMECCQLVCTDCLQEHTIDIYSSYNTTPFRCIKCESEEYDGQREKEQWEEYGTKDCNRTSITCMDDIYYSDEDDGSEEEEQKEGSVGSVGSAPSTSYMTVTTTTIEVYTLYIINNNS